MTADGQTFGEDSRALATAVTTLAARAGCTIAVAESLTGGLVCGVLVDVPGASRTVRGAVVAYATELKSQLLGVDAELLEREGPVHPEVARQMAQGAASRLGADLGLATTGVAGPDPQGGKAPGTVFVAAARTGRPVVVRRLALDGDRAAIRDESVRQVLALATEVLRPG